MVLSEVFRQKLQRDKSVELVVFGFVNDAHPTATELFDDPVMRDGAADQGLGVLHVAHILGVRLCQVNEAIPPRCQDICDSAG